MPPLKQWKFFNENNSKFLNAAVSEVSKIAFIITICKSGNIHEYKMIEIRKANIDDHIILTEITKKSKAYWGYSDEQMNDWSDVLTIKEEYIQNNEVYKLLNNNSTVAYYSYLIINENTVKLDNLFVLPDEMGKGYGKLLMNDFILKIKKGQAKRIILDADPNAQQFYESFGFTKIGKIETSIKNRFLPVMELRF